MWLSHIQWIMQLSTYEFIIERAELGVENKENHRTAGFLSLSTVHVLGWITLGCGGLSWAI